MLLFYGGSILFVALVACVAIYLHISRDNGSPADPVLSGELAERESDLKGLIPSQAAVALFAQSPQAVFDAWGAISTQLLGEDAASAWLSGTFGDGESLSSILARYSVKPDAPIAVMLEFAPVERQFETHFAVVLRCSDSSGFVNSAWPMRTSAVTAPRLLAERDGYALILHGSLACAAWDDWIAISDSTDFVSDVAEGFLENAARLDTATMSDETISCFFYPNRVQAVWLPIRAWLRVTWPPLSSKIAKSLDVLQPAQEDPGPIVSAIRYSDEEMAARVTWSVSDCPRLAAMLGKLPANETELLPANPDSVAAGEIVLSGMSETLFRNWMVQVAESTHDADVGDAVSRIANSISGRVAFDIGTFDAEEYQMRTAWDCDNGEDTVSALTSILPVVPGADATADTGIVIHTARVIQPVYFAVAQNRAYLATDLNDIRDMAGARSSGGIQAAGAYRLRLRVRGAHLAQSLEQTSTFESLGLPDSFRSMMSHVAQGEVVWSTDQSSESIALRIAFARPN